MRALKIVLLLLFCALLAALSGCKPSYPRERVTESVLKIIKKEYAITGNAALVGDTLYLNIKIPGMVTTEQKMLPRVLDKAQGAVLAVTRVALSSDADIRYVVITAQDPSWKMRLRFIQRIEDVKGYLYQRISHGDYEDRLVVEIENRPSENNVLMPLKALEPREFLGRLIVSQVNMLSRSNPFLAVVLGNAQMEYQGYTDTELVVQVSNYLSPQVLPFFEEVVNEKSIKILSKINLWQLKQVRVIEPDNTSHVIAIGR